jgi:hypothetical protein
MNTQQTLLKLVKNIHHYYGDIVRVLYLSSAIFMLLLLPFVTDYIPVPTYIALLIILTLGIVAGVTNPAQRWVAVLDTFIAFGGVFIFGYYSIESYLFYSIFNLYFWANQIQAVIFLFALYFSVKTMRGFFLKDIY